MVGPFVKKKNYQKKLNTNRVHRRGSVLVRVFLFKRKFVLSIFLYAWQFPASSDLVNFDAHSRRLFWTLTLALGDFFQLSSALFLLFATLSLSGDGNFDAAPIVKRSTVVVFSPELNLTSYIDMN